MRSWIEKRFTDATIIPLEEGWSSDHKIILDFVTHRWLVRISEKKTFDAKQEEFHAIKQLSHLRSIPKAIEMGVIEDEVYVIYSYLEGEPLEITLPLLFEHEQHTLGVKAGRILKEIHTLTKRENLNTKEVLAKKIQTREAKMQALGVHFDGYELCLAKLKELHENYQQTEACFRHGDFHVGNMLYTPEGNVGVVDFNRSDIGDPMEDFNRMFQFTKNISPAFAKGQLKGYGLEINEETFKHLMLFVLMDATFGILWSLEFGDDDVKRHEAFVKQLLKETRNFETFIPSWAVSDGQ